MTHLLRLALFLVSLFYFVATGVQAGELKPAPIYLPVSQHSWDVALQTKNPVVLQIGFRTDLFNRYQDAFSALSWELPANFPRFDVNEISWGLHSTLFKDEAFSLEDLKSLSTFLLTLNRETLESRALVGPVRVFDPSAPTIAIGGQERKTLVLIPEQEFIAWHLRFWALLKERAPQLHARFFKGRDPDLKDAQIALLECGGAEECSEREMERAADKLAQLIKKISIGYPVVVFDFLKTPLQLVTGQHGSDLPPTSLISFSLDAERLQTEPSPVGVWVGWEGKARSLIEFETEKLILGDSAPYTARGSSQSQTWYGGPKFLPREPIKEFLRKLPTPLSATIERQLSKLSIYNHPSAVDPSQGLYAPHMAYENLTLERAGILALARRELGVASSEKVSTGLSLYGSSTKSEIRNPADSDLILSAIVHVPNTIAELSEAENYARNIFFEEVLRPIIERARAEKLSFSELRMGSDFTMGLDAENPDLMHRYENNPSLSNQEVLDGAYKDQAGRVWSLQELIALEDFMKAKIDLFPSINERMPISLQFFLGFEWQGKTHFLRRKGLKGAHSTLMETGVYLGAESYATALALDRIISYYVMQRGHNAARAIGEILPMAYPSLKSGAWPELAEPLWRTKFLKRFYAFLIVLRKRGGGGLDEIFFEGTKHLLEKEGEWDQRLSLSGVIIQIKEAINRPEVAFLGKLKDIITDLEEFVERGQNGQLLTEKQWQTRSSELEILLPALKRLVQDGTVPDLGSSFWDALSHFERTLDRARSVESLPARQYLAGRNGSRAELKEIYSRFKTTIEQIDARYNVDPSFKGALPLSVREFISAFTSLSPHFYSNWVRARANPSEKTLQLIYRLMGIEQTPGKIALMKKIDADWRTMSREEIREAQSAIFSKDCQALLRR